MFNSDNTTYTTEQFTLMLGDCLERMKELESGSIDCVITDLPYQITACVFFVSKKYSAFDILTLSFILN